MRMNFFGDSYDVVKRFLLQSVAPEAEWIAFPMFTHRVAPEKLKAFASFLGVQVVSPAPLTASTNRARHLAASEHHRHIFLDPDIGIRLRPPKRRDAVKYVLAPELISLCCESPERLLLVFDQSVPRGAELKSIKEKLVCFRDAGVCGFAYLSHACFVVLSASNSACLRAKENLLATGLPIARLISCPTTASNRRGKTHALECGR